MPSLTEIRRQYEQLRHTRAEQLQSRERMPHLYGLFTIVYAERLYGKMAQERAGTMDPLSTHHGFELFYCYPTAADLWADRDIQPRPTVIVPKRTSAQTSMQIGEQWAQERPEEVKKWLRDVYKYRRNHPQLTPGQRAFRDRELATF